MLSLVFVPAVFLVMDDVHRLLGRIFGRFVGAVDEPDHPAAAAPIALTAKAEPAAKGSYGMAAE